jgi:hypothetical protein
MTPAFFRPSYQTLIPLPPYPVTEFYCALRAAYPAGDGSIAILHSILQKETTRQVPLGKQQSRS